MARIDDDGSVREVTLAEWETRKRFVSFSTEDAELLRAIHHIALTHVDTIVDRLYDQLLQFEETKVFFPSAEVISRVKALQREYFLGLTQGDYGEAYLVDRLRIGRVHQRIGLSPQWYMGAYSIYEQQTLPLIMGALESDPQLAHRSCLALLRIMALDVDLAITTYIAAQQRVVSLQREEMATMAQQLWQTAKLATLGELAASIAHEINNPLSTVSLRIEGLLTHAAEDDPSRRSLEVIDDELERIATLVANLLQFSRRSEGRISTIDLREELRRSLELVHSHLRNRRVTVVEDFAPDTPTVHADRQNLRQVFLNLITNASDAMPEGGTLTVRTRRGGEASAVIELTDSGAGISPEQLPRIFETFYTTKAEGQGTGLGLQICKRIVEGLHGALEIESVVGKGTTVRIVLPLANGANGSSLADP